MIGIFFQSAMVIGAYQRADGHDPTLAVASFFAIPVVVTEGVGPVDAVKRSSTVITGIWGTSVRTTLRFGAIRFVLMIIPLALLVSLLALAALGIVFGAIATYARALIYRWATGPPGHRATGPPGDRSPASTRRCSPGRSSRSGADAADRTAPPAPPWRADV